MSHGQHVAGRDRALQAGVPLTAHTLHYPRQDAVICTCVFNPRGWASRYRLAREFLERSRNSGARVVVTEVAFGDRPLEMSDAPCDLYIPLRTRWELWHKERSLNIAIEQAVRSWPATQYVFTIDCDVTFLRPNWVESACEMLQHYAVIQPFGEALDLGPDEEMNWRAPGLLRVFHERGYHCLPKKLDYHHEGHPGLAWGWRRETLDRVGGLLDVCIAGSGDLHMATALMGDEQYHNHFTALVDHFSPGFLQAIRLWRESAAAVVRQNIGYLPGAIAHHWHGRSRQRGYRPRWDLVGFHQYDPYADLLRDASGLYRFRPGREKLAQDIRRSLGERNEDGMER